MCGADRLQIAISDGNPGSPPRVRSRRRERADPHHRSGITSACAEQTVHEPMRPTASGDHLRVCGADGLLKLLVPANSGSPPRVRSRPQFQCFSDGEDGITSACAEQTWCRRWTRWLTRDHLRVCGADNDASTSDLGRMGSPPRVRSRPDEPRRTHVRRGITSACAEQTCSLSSGSR